MNSYFVMLLTIAYAIGSLIVLAILIGLGFLLTHIRSKKLKQEYKESNVQLKQKIIKRIQSKKLNFSSIGNKK